MGQFVKGTFPRFFLLAGNGFLLASLCFCNAAVSQEATSQTEVVRPNVVLILADDLGFTDIAPFGSEISTPTLSALAENGLSFTNYHTAASCAPTRAMLLTGVDSHRAGVPNIPEMIPPEQAKFSHYQGTLGHNVVTVATLLQDAGYHTYLTGKWHLGKTPDLLPSRRGFERTVVMADTGADNWEQKPYLPIYDKANWFADGEEFELPEDFYSSRFLVDKAIEFIDSHSSDEQPFFTYLPFQAVHLPVQAPQEFIDHYMGVYDSGWDALREQRRLRAIELGVIPAGSAQVKMSTTDDWEALDGEQRLYQAKSMAVYAAMVEAMDHHLGRLIEHLKVTGRYQNTVFIFASDNGSEASGTANPNTSLGRFVMGRQGYDIEYEGLGLKGSFNALSPSFASASAAPLSFYKFYAGEGGMRVPMIIAGSSIPVKNQLSNAFTYVTDIAPTILELTGVKPPGERYGGRPIEPMVGRNLMPLLDGSAERVYAERDSVGYELAGNAALFQGDYKIVLNRGPVGDSQWHLFNIVTDPGETSELSGLEPERLQQMLSAYQTYVDDNGVLPVPAGYNGKIQIVMNTLQQRFGKQILLILLTLLIIVPFYVAYRVRRTS